MEEQYKSDFITDLNDIIQKVINIQKGQDLIQILLSFVKKTLNCENVIIWIWDDRKQALVPRFYEGFEEKEIEKHVFHKGEGIIGSVFNSGEIIYEKDLKNSKLFVKKGNNVEHIRDILAIPLYFENRIYGVFDITNKKKGFFTPEDIEKAKIISYIFTLYFNMQSKQSYYYKNYQFYSILIDILSLERYNESEFTFFNHLIEVLKNSFLTEVGVIIKKAGFKIFSSGKEFIPPMSSLGGDSIITPYNDGFLLNFNINQKFIYIYFSDLKAFEQLIDSSQYEEVFFIVLQRVIQEFYKSLDIKNKNLHLDFLQTLILKAYNFDDDIIKVYIDKGLEIYNNYKLYSLEYYELKSDKYELFYTEGPLKNERVFFLKDSEIIDMLQRDNVFILSKDSSPIYEYFKMPINVIDKTESLFAKGIKLNSEIHFIFIFRWDHLFAPEMNFFNFIDIIEKQIVIKDKIKNYINNYRSSRNSIFQMFLNLVKFFDKKLYFHQLNVNRIALKLNKLLNINFNEEYVELVSYLHDVGKLFVMDEENKTHHKKSFDFIKNIELPEIVKDAILYHEERWDGSGPFGLKGEEIPALARLVNFANVIENYIHNHGFKGLKEYLNEISDVVIEKEVVNIILKNWDYSLANIRESYEKY